jgi:predicted aspartyl protease
MAERRSGVNIAIDANRIKVVLLGVTTGAKMAGDMGTFRTDVEVENPTRPGDRRVVRAALVDTGAALSWFPRDIVESLGARRLKIWHFRQADGTVLSRWTAEVRVYAGGTSTIDEVVIGEPGDLVLLGARSLEGLNLRVDPVSMRLVDAGPAPAAIAS